MNTATYPLAALALALVACTSQTQLTVTRSAAVNATAINATESITTSPAAISYSFSKADLADIVAGDQPAVILGGKVAPLLTGVATGTLTAAMPPLTAPPTPNLDGELRLLFQSSKGSVIKLVKVAALQVAPAQVTVVGTVKTSTASAN